MVIICFCLAMGSAIFASGLDFSPFDFWIEDFGSTATNPGGALFYDLGFILTGLFIDVYSLGFESLYTENWVYNIVVLTGQIATIVAGLTMIFEGFGYLLWQMKPLIWSISFFLSIGVAITLLCSCMALRHSKYENTVCAGITAMALILLLAITSYLDITPIITEWFAAASMLTWVAMVSRDMRRQVKK